MGAAFFAGLECVQRLLLEDLGGYHPLRAHGETFLPEPADAATHFRPWLLVAAAGGRRAGRRHHLAAGARDARRRRRRR